MHGVVLLLHLLGAAVWTGGHLILALSVLPRAFRQRSISELRQFESLYERVGIPALLIQIVTGIWLASQLVPDFRLWGIFAYPVARLIGIKILLLIVTVLLAVDARIRVIPKLTEKQLPLLAWHVIPVTIISVAYVVIGVAFRIGWWY